MRTVKSNAKRQNVGLTVPVATRQARKIVDQVMPGVAATVESKLSHDLATDTATVVTTVTFPANLPAAKRFAVQANLLTGRIGMVVADSSIVITRKVR
jgi:hypothetical protein